MYFKQWIAYIADCLLSGELDNHTLPVRQISKVYSRCRSPIRIQIPKFIVSQLVSKATKDKDILPEFVYYRLSCLP